MTSKEKIIYGLVDPNLKQIRYVGRSSSGLWRPNAHRHPGKLHKDQTHCGRWIRKLLASGLDYSVVVLEADVLDLNARERYWIAHGRQQGWPLTNILDGGRGWSGGISFTRQHRKKISIALKGRKLSLEHCKKISDRQKGRKWDNSAAAASRIGSHHTDEAKKKIGLGQAGKRMSDAGKKALRDFHSKPVRDLTTGVVYASQKIAAKELGLCYESVNRVLCGKHHTTGGRFFAFLNGS